MHDATKRMISDVSTFNGRCTESDDMDCSMAIAVIMGLLFVQNVIVLMSRMRKYAQGDQMWSPCIVN